jgi:hypothetical protein
VIDKDGLLADLKPQVRKLEQDLRQRAETEAEFAGPLNAEWQQAHKAGRTAATYETWLDGEITQSAVAWILGTVFLRFCEDNYLIDVPYLAGRSDRTAIAAERQAEFFEREPLKTDRDWMQAGFTEMSKASGVAAGLFDEDHNPMWKITPSHSAAKNLLAFWRTPRSDGTIAHDFADPGWDTRFLGDLYQDLSDHAKKTFALLQTPEFVEDFILDLTLKPAIDEFGIEPDPPRARPDLPRTLRVIDPACGSGHFLLGAFAKLLDAWEQHAPTMDPWDRITRILTGLHGADKNPFAASIARFRLLIAVMKAGDVKRLTEAPDFPLNIAVADSLLHGRGGPGEQGELFSASGFFTYRAEDVARFICDADLLGANSYHVVVGNAPYITIRDKQENSKYRNSYMTCYREYSLSAPFAERFFWLAKIVANNNRGSGYVGQITANSFMKREFGKVLIEDFFAQKVELTHVIDSSGAYVPGHGTPTVILIGRNMLPTTRPVLGVLGIRGEPAQPKDAANGLVWRAIVDQIRHPGTESDWVTVAELSRHRLHSHPWSLSGGKAGSIMEQIEKGTASRLKEHIEAVGFAAITGEDEAYFIPSNMIARAEVKGAITVVTGEVLRDYRLDPSIVSLWPYNEYFRLGSTFEVSLILKILWPNREMLQRRKRFGRQVETIPGFVWYEYRELYPARLRTPLSIAFAFIATHNHFALDRGGNVFNRSAPVIKLPEGSDADYHLKLLGVLNSSTACFWLKQVSHNKGTQGINEGFKSQDWERFYEFTGTKLENFPLPTELPLEFGRALDDLAQRLTTTEPSAVCGYGVPSRGRLDAAQTEHGHIRARMIALQEELDWEVYRLYGLLSEDEAAGLQADPESIPGLELGERAFEIVLARRMATGEVETQWFTRHGSTPITEIPSHWPREYRDIVQRRIDVIGRRRDIGLIERPECKRRWQSASRQKKEAAALRSWLLDRCERRDLWFAASDSGRDEPRPLTVSRLADLLHKDSDFLAVARLYGGSNAELSQVVAEITEAEHLPYLAALRYVDSGLRKRAQWERTWALQREEDATGQRLNIPVPPKYAKADFRRASFWSNRGKLDVPKERFISYPQASADGDGSLLLGWAGWDHREQAHALMMIMEDRVARDGWGRDGLIPLVAGLAEVLPWVRQWHGEVDPAFGVSPADAYAAYLDDQMRRCGASAADLAAWRPPARGRGGRNRAAR